MSQPNVLTYSIDNKKTVIAKNSFQYGGKTSWKFHDILLSENNSL